ncbi:cobalamin-binding protein [Halobacteriales archaeon QS_3_64_16]|nr:MAG: cobalamin-binding protein [Halobacteriales archaeon QS_3_64_16]
MRIATLLPSATEIVHALGAEPVAVSHECDYPPEAAEKPALNRSHVDPDASSSEIDNQVLEAEQGAGVYEIDLDALEAADPDLIVTQGICDVCAVDSVLVEEAVSELELNAEILTTDPHSLGDVFTDIQRIGTAIGEEHRAGELCTDLRKRVRAVESRVEGIDTDDRPRVAVLDWLDPVMVAGHWVPELVETAGGTYDLAAPGDRSEPRDWANVREYDPEVLVAAPCGFDLDQTAENLADLTDRPGWEELSAVRDGRTVAIDGSQFLNRPGPRLVDSLELLAQVIHPEAFEEGDPVATEGMEPLLAPPA